MTNRDADDEAIDRQSLAIEKAARRAVNDALRQHKRDGNPIVTWENGQVRRVSADEIAIDDDES